MLACGWIRNDTGPKWKQHTERQKWIAAHGTQDSFFEHLDESSHPQEPRVDTWMTRSTAQPNGHIVLVDLLCLWKPKRDEIQLTLDKKPQNCKNSFCLGSFLTTRSRTYHDYNDSLSEIPFSSLDTQSKSHEVQTDWLALSQPVITTKCCIHDEKKAMTVAHIRTRHQQGQGAGRTKDGCPSQTNVIFVVMDALEGVREDEVLVLHCELNGYCQEPDERHSERSRVSELFQPADGCQFERSRVSSELLQSAGSCQSENSRVVSEFHSCQAEDEGGAFQVQDDDFHLPEFHSWSFFVGVFCFLASTIFFCKKYETYEPGAVRLEMRRGCMTLNEGLGVQFCVDLLNCTRGSKHWSYG